MPIYVQLKHEIEELSGKYKHILQENTTVVTTVMARPLKMCIEFKENVNSGNVKSKFHCIQLFAQSLHFYMQILVSRFSTCHSICLSLYTCYVYLADTRRGSYRTNCISTSAVLPTVSPATVSNYQQISWWDTTTIWAPSWKGVHNEGSVYIWCVCRRSQWDLPGSEQSLWEYIQENRHPVSKR